MAVLDGTDIVYIERCRAPGPREIDLNLHVGSRLPAYCTSMGKVLLAFLPPRERNALLDGAGARAPRPEHDHGEARAAQGARAACASAASP